MFYQASKTDFTGLVSLRHVENGPTQTCPRGVLDVHVIKKSEGPGLNAALVAGVAVREQKKPTFEQTSLFNNFIFLK